MKALTCQLIKASSWIIFAVASASASAHADTTIDCATKDGSHFVVHYAAGAVKAGYSNGLHGEVDMGSTSVRKNGEIYSYAFKIVSKQQFEHCGNEYFYNSFGEHLDVLLTRAEEAISGDGRYEKMTYRLNFNSAHPERSEIVSNMAFAEMVFATLHGSYDKGTDYRDAASCTVKRN